VPLRGLQVGGCWRLCLQSVWCLFAGGLHAGSLCQWISAAPWCGVCGYACRVPACAACGSGPRSTRSRQQQPRLRRLTSRRGRGWCRAARPRPLRQRAAAAAAAMPRCLPRGMRTARCGCGTCMGRRPCSWAPCRVRLPPRRSRACGVAGLLLCPHWSLRGSRGWSSAATRAARCVLFAVCTRGVGLVPQRSSLHCSQVSFFAVKTPADAVRTGDRHPPPPPPTHRCACFSSAAHPSASSAWCSSLLAGATTTRA
jgi:hypothetical protein